MRRGRAKVVCNGCAYLLVVEGMEPLCLAMAYFVDSELRRKVDVKGVKLAAKVNIGKNCLRKRLFSWYAWKLHRWFKKDLMKKHIRYLGRNLALYEELKHGKRSGD